MLPRGALLFACLLALPARAESVRVNVDGPEATLVLPEGHCALQRGNATDRVVIENVERVVASSNRVLVSFAECSQLAALREQRRQYLDDFGQYMMPLRGNRNTMAPADFARGMAEFFKSQGAALMRDAEQETRDRIGSLRLGIRLGENRMLGILRTDQRASYLGLVQSLGLPGGETKVQVGIVAMGVIKQRVVSLNLYTPLPEGDAGTGTTIGLLNLSASTYAAMTEANSR